MTLPIFQNVFLGFHDIETPQPYDMEGEAEELIESFKQSFVAEQGEDDLSSRAKRALAVETHRLVEELMSSMRQFVAAIMPPELATENCDYAVEQAHGARLPLDEQFIRLERGADMEPDPDDSIQFRLVNTTLEQNYQAVLDHLTAARIAEEMDTPTYVERLRGAFKRAREGSRAQATKLETHIDRARTLALRLSVADAIARFVREKVIPRLENAQKGRDEETADLESALSRLERFVSNTKAFNDHFGKFLDLSHTSLTCIRRDFASQANMAGAEGESILVSRDIERHAFFRPLPLVWALSVTILVKIVLAHNTSETLHYVAIPVLLLTFVLTWTLSIYIGVWARSTRMKEVQGHMRQQLRALLLADNVDEELVEFPRISADHVAPRHERLAPFSYRGHASRHKRTVMRRNLLALTIPAVLGIVVLITRKNVDHDFIARFSNAEPCVLASGRLVFATRDSFFVQPHSSGTGPLQWALSRIFPELLADVVERSDIISVGVGSASLASYEAGDAGERTLPHCLSAGRSGGDADDGQMASMTVHLGDTSLEVLTQAVAGGANPSPKIFDAVIIDARKSIELELSKPDPAEIDLSIILAALHTIRTRFGNEITMTEALSIVFGGSRSEVSRLELPDSFIAFLGGEDGQGGLPGELRALRLALESSNKLAVDFAADLDVDQDGDAVVKLLDEKLSSIISQQDQLRVALTHSLTARNNGTVVVTPAFFAPTGGEDHGAPRGTINAHIFQTTISLAATGKALTKIENTLVLPFFAAPVRNGNPQLATPQGAFDWGADTRYLSDPEVTADGTSYFGRIAQTLEGCLIGDATVEIDLIGLASPSWDGPIGAYSSETLNYYLAEGRRVGAIRRLSELMDSTSERRVRVQLADGSNVAMPELVTLATSGADIDEFLPRFGRFDNESSFESRRETLLGVTGLDPETESPLEELFARSVVLRMVRTDGGPCEF